MPDSLLSLDLLMGHSPPADERSMRILDAALGLFERYGIRRTATDDIAKHAGVGRMTLYRKFPRKQDIIAALVEREARGVLARVETAVAACNDGRERVIESFMTVVNDLARHPVLRRLIASDSEMMLPLLTLDASPLLTLGRQFLTAKITAARRHVDSTSLADPEHVAEVVTRFTLSLLLTPDSVLPFENGTAMRDFTRRMIVPMVLGT